MKKNGFTIAEILIAMAVIGIVATISSPILSNVIPDRDKLAMLKAYKNLNDATQEIINDPGYYINNDCEGLACTAQAESLTSDIYSGDSKYAQLLARTFNGEGATATAITTSKYSFETADKSLWVVEKSGNNYHVTVDIDGSEGKNSVYTSTVKAPDQFKFLVNSNGSIHPADALTDAYLITKSNLKNRKADLQKAATLYNSTYK